MLNNPEKPIQVNFTPEFKRNIRQLSKKYRHIKSDVQPVIEQLETGQTPGEQIPRVRYPVFKIRIRNTDIKKGKRAGYRMVYYVKTQISIILITIYSKTEQGDVSPETVRRIIAEYDDTPLL